MGGIVQRVSVKATNISVVSSSMHLVLTGSADVLILYWHLCLYFSMDSCYVLRFDRTELTSSVEIGDENVKAGFRSSERCRRGASLYTR